MPMSCTLPSCATFSCIWRCRASFARWSECVQEEWIRNLLDNRPDLTRTQLERTRQLMNVHVPDALVTRYEQLIPALTLPDPNDRHVLAAAIRGGASVIVTNNLQDFPENFLEEYEIDVQTPDEFILHPIGLYPAEVCAAAEDHRASLHNPAMSREEYLEMLLHQGLVETVRALRGICG